MGRLRTFLNVEPGEELPVLLLFLYLTLALTSYTIARAVRDALFLNQFSAMALPYVYVGLAILVGLVVFVYVRLSPRLGQRRLISGTLIFFVTNVLLLWWAVRLHWSPGAVVFYLWTNIFGIILTTQVWTVANDVLDLRQAKRLFPLISSGGILGAVVGGVIAALAVRFVGTDNLVIFLIPLLGACMVGVQVLTRRYGHSGRGSRIAAGLGEEKKSTPTPLKTIMSSPYLRLIAALLALSAIATLIVDFQFKIVVQESFRSKDQLTTFFGSFYAYLGGFSFLLQFLAGSRIVEKYGVRATLLVLPMTLLAGTAVLVAFPLRLWAGSFLKGSDGALRYSIDKSAIELLYLPVPASIKAEVKAVIDMVLQRLSDGVGGILLLVLTRVFGLGLTGVSLFNMGLISVWLWVGFQMRKEYLSAIRKSFERPGLPKATVRHAIGDQGSMATLQPMLKSKVEDVVLYAIELALTLGRKDWIPATLLTHPSPKVRVKAMEIVLMTEAQILERVQADSDPRVIARAIGRMYDAGQPEQAQAAIARLLEAPDPKARLAVLIFLAQRGSREDVEMLREFLPRIVEGLEATPEQWKEIADVLGEIPHPAAADFHARLLQHPDRAVRKRAILSAGGAGHRELVPYLVRLLADRRYASEARRALQAYGARILGTLADILRDPTEEIEVRRSLPPVLAYMPNQPAVELLLESLFDYDGLLRYRAIRALGKLRVIDPDLLFDPEKVSLRIREECENTLWYRQALESLYPKGASPDLLTQLLKDKVNRGRERVFRLLALLLPPTTACASFLAMIEDDRLMKASAAEYLDNVLPGRLKQAVLPLIEPRQGFLRQRADIGVILRACLRSPDPILRECAEDAVAKNRWPEFNTTSEAVARTAGGSGHG